MYGVVTDRKAGKNRQPLRKQLQIPCPRRTQITPCVLHHQLAMSDLRACLHEGGGPHIGAEVTCGGSPHLSCKHDQIKMRDYMDTRVTPPPWGTMRIWSYFHVNLRNINDKYYYLQGEGALSKVLYREAPPRIPTPSL